MNKMIYLNDCIEYCNCEMSMLIGQHQSVAVSALRRVTYYLKDQAIEAEPVRTGLWIIDPGCGDYGRCSECEGKSGTQWDGVEPIPLLTAYCPHCGAKMKGV